MKWVIIEDIKQVERMERDGEGDRFPSTSTSTSTFNMKSNSNDANANSTRANTGNMRLDMNVNTTGHNNVNAHNMNMGGGKPRYGGTVKRVGSGEQKLDPSSPMATSNINHSNNSTHSTNSDHFDVEEKVFVDDEMQLRRSSSYTPFPTVLDFTQKYLTKQELQEAIDLKLVRTLPKTNNTPPLMNVTLGNNLRRFFPPRRAISTEWVLIYATYANGISLTTMTDRMLQSNQPQLIVIKDFRGNIFGGYSSSQWYSDGLYHGNGECFLWKQKNANENEDLVQAFKWTGENSYFMIHSKKGVPYLAMGGGNGKFGLYVDDFLQKGTSESCLTFANDPLSNSFDFEIAALEVWEIQPA